MDRYQQPVGHQELKTPNPPRCLHPLRQRRRARTPLAKLRSAKPRPFFPLFFHVSSPCLSSLNSLALCISSQEPSPRRPVRLPPSGTGSLVRSGGSPPPS